MPRNKTAKKMTKSNSKKHCNKVPCGKCIRGCKPSYCVTKKEISKNWCGHTKNKTVKMLKTDKNSVYTDELHKKMPYIWRFLDNKTRKKMVRLAKKPIHEINITGSEIKH